MDSDVDAQFQVLYTQLRAAARRQLAKGRPGETLNTTALVHEAYVKLVQSDASSWRDSSHFFALAARAMRQVAIDYARRAVAEKRGGDAPAVPLEGIDVPDVTRPRELLAIDAALDRLEGLDPHLAKVVELRFYAGLTVEEAAEALKVSARTVKRDWRKARAFLFDAIRGNVSGDQS